MVISKNNNFNRSTLLIALSFAVGFGVATGAYFTIFCEECVSVLPKPSKEDPCTNDPRCIVPITNDVDTTIASKIGHEKVKFLHDLVAKPIIQNALKSSNQKDSKMKEDIRNQIKPIEIEQIYGQYDPGSDRIGRKSALFLCD